MSYTRLFNSFIEVLELIFKGHRAKTSFHSFFHDNFFLIQPFLKRFSVCG
jgi:hypothetical protein